jgi:ParB/RepB/Spo0J family partition protein
MEIRTVRLDQLVSTGNIRSVEAQDPALLELAASMRESGQEVEIRVYPAGDGLYFVKSGHRRVAAAHLNGWETLRAVVEEPPSEEADLLVSQYNENDLRTEMGYLDKARVYQRLKDLGWSQRQIAQKFAKSDAEISLALAALRADPKLQKAIDRGEIKPSAVEPLLSQPLEVQAKLAEAAIRAKTVRQVAALVRTHQQQTDASPKKTNQESNLPQDADPLELLAAQELDEALEHMRLAEQTRIQHPELVRKSRPTVEELVRKAAALMEYLDGRAWDDTQDLV